jgi:hypothetical protein
MRAEINEREMKIINKTKSLDFEKISKIDKHFANLTKRKGKKTQINKIRDEKGNFHTIISVASNNLKSNNN